MVAFLKKDYRQAEQACTQIAFLEKLPDYLEAAWLAASLKEKIDFVPRSNKGERYYAAILINDKAMPEHVTYNGLVQQALHGRLNYENNKQKGLKTYLVAPETTLYSTMSPEAMLKWMVDTTRVVAVSATIGGQTAQKQLHKRYDFQCIKLPKMQSKLRVDYPVQFCKTENDQLELIGQICSRYSKEVTQHKSRCFLITAESIESAEKIKKYLMGLKDHRFTPEVLHAEMDISDETMAQVESRAGKSNHILIALNGLIERGFDIKLSTATQTIVISTDLSNECTEDQKKGRAGRINSKTGQRDKGKFFGVYNLDKERNRHSDSQQLIKDIYPNPEKFIQSQFLAHNKQELQLALSKQLVSISKDAIQNHFNALILAKSKHLMPQQRAEILSLYSNTLNKLTTILPAAGFTKNNATGEALRKQYNQQLIETYTKCFGNIHAVLGMQEKPQLTDLETEIRNKQQELLFEFDEMMQQELKIVEQKVHKRWKKGVYFNAYLEQGNQSMYSVLLNYFYKTFLPKAAQTAVEEALENLKNKLMTKVYNNFDFIDSLTLMSKHANNNTVFCEPENTKNNFKIEQSLGNKGTITLLYDPLAGKPGQIIVCSSDMASLEDFRDVIGETYAALNCSHKLPFRIGQLKNGQNQVVLDLSSHAFDKNRTEWLRMIAEKMGVDASELLKYAHIPPLDTMQKIAKNNNNNNDDRIAYYKNYMMCIAQGDKIAVEVLTQAAKPFLYYNIDGEILTAPPLPFNNYEEALDNYRKREVIECISALLKTHKNTPFKEKLLCKQQLECLYSLCEKMAMDDKKTAQAIFDDFKKQTYSVLGKELTFDQLMKERLKKSNLIFADDVSPDFSRVVETIDKLLCKETQQAEMGFEKNSGSRKI